MEEILELFKKAIIYKLDEMSILHSAVRPSADEFYKMACAIKMCSEIKNILSTVSFEIIPLSG